MDQQIVTLNVGGKRYSAALHTLRKEPNSMLGSMFNEKWCPDPKSDDEHFIDRDGDQFRFVLNYLENDKEMSMPMTMHDVRALSNEATFYQLDGLTALLKTYANSLQTAPYVGCRIRFKPHIVDRYYEEIYVAVKSASPYLFVATDKSSGNGVSYCPCCNGKQEILKHVDVESEVEKFKVDLKSLTYKVARFVSTDRKDGLILDDPQFRQMHIPRSFVITVTKKRCGF